MRRPSLASSGPGKASSFEVSASEGKLPGEGHLRRSLCQKFFFFLNFNFKAFKLKTLQFILLIFKRQLPRPPWQPKKAPNSHSCCPTSWSVSLSSVLLLLLFSSPLTAPHVQLALQYLFSLLFSLPLLLISHSLLSFPQIGCNSSFFFPCNFIELIFVFLLF